MANVCHHSRSLDLPLPTGYLPHQLCALEEVDGDQQRVRAKRKDASQLFEPVFWQDLFFYTNFTQIT